MPVQESEITLRLVRWVSIGGIAGTVGFFLAVLLIGVTRDGYNSVSDEISQLGAAGVPGAWMQAANFIVFGFLVIALAWGLQKAIEGHGVRRGPVLVGTFGLLAAVGNGVFPSDQYGDPETTVGNLHSLTAGFGFIALIVAMFVLPRRLRLDGNWSDLARLSKRLGVVSTILMLLYLFAAESEGFLDDHVGLVQRVFAATALGWLLILSVRLFRVSRTAAVVEAGS